MSRSIPNRKPEYLYHGTGEGAFRQIRQHGLKCRNGKVYCSVTEKYAQTYSRRKGAPHGDRILRIRFSDRFASDASNAGGDYISREDISPADIEVKTSRVWMPIQAYSNPEVGIMPMMAPETENEVGFAETEESENEPRPG